MEIAKLGEFGLIDRLTENIEIKNESTKYGVGDDCAVLSYPDKEVLVTTDLLMEGVHFDLTYIDLRHLGYKSAMVNISDVFAPNNLCLPDGLCQNQLECPHPNRNSFQHPSIQPLLDSMPVLNAHLKFSEYAVAKPFHG